MYIIKCNKTNINNEMIVLYLSWNEEDNPCYGDQISQLKSVQEIELVTHIQFCNET